MAEPPLTLDPIDAWYRAECAAMDQLPAGGLILGGLLYGEVFLNIFQKYCLPSLLAPANAAALAANHATIGLYADAATAKALQASVAFAAARGVSLRVRIVPDAVIAHQAFWVRLGCAMHLWAQRAYRVGRPYHLLMPDQSYSERYFPNLFRIASVHPSIAQIGLNTNMTAASEIEAYRTSDGVLPIPARDLGSIAWRHLHWRMSRHVLNNATVDKMPNMHYQTWRARDRVMVYSPHCNPIYVAPEVGKKLDSGTTPTATVDALIQHLFGTDFYVPNVLDDMTCINLERPGQLREPPEWPVYLSMDGFIDRCAREVQLKRSHLVYYRTAHEMAAEELVDMPTADVVQERQLQLVALMEQKLAEWGG